jgi:hypothetical protein
MVINEDIVIQALLVVREAADELDEWIRDNAGMPRRIGYAANHQLDALRKVQHGLEDAVR